MKKVLSLIFSLLFIESNIYADNEMSENARPDDQTISLYEYKKKLLIKTRGDQGRLYTIKPKNNAKDFIFEKNISSSNLEKQLSKGYLLSYLFYDKGVIKYDGKAKDNRFLDNITNKTLFYTHSTGKSIVSYIVGHAICDGYISSIDEKIDWPMMKNTLYQGQPLRNLLNMSAGDKHLVDKNTTRFKGSERHHRDMGLDSIAQLLEGTKARGNKVFYNNTLSDIIANYVVLKAGAKYDELMKKIFQDKVKIENEVSYEKHGYAYEFKKNEFSGTPQTLASYSFFMTRLDFLRVAEAMMKDYQNKTCVGNYLRESQQQAKSWYKYRPTKKNAHWYLHNYSKKYGSQFYFDFSGMKDRNIIGTEGKNGQNILIDLDNSRIVITNSAATGWNVKTFMLNVIKDGKLPK